MFLKLSRGTKSGLHNHSRRYRKDFLNLFGFGFEGVDYKADINEMVAIPSIV